MQPPFIFRSDLHLPIEHQRLLTQYGRFKIFVTGSLGHAVAHMQGQKVLFSGVAKSSVRSPFPISKPMATLAFINIAVDGIYKPIFETLIFLSVAAYSHSLLTVLQVI